MCSESEYYIMFGPDICGFGNNRVQVILHYQGKYHEDNKTIKCRDWEDFEYIPDPDAKKPDDWNKGQWKPRIMDNPNYQGEWIYPEMDNPEYKPDPTICRYYNIRVLSLDLWQVKSGSIFENFLLTNDEEFAEEVGNKTWRIKRTSVNYFEIAHSKQDVEKQRREPSGERVKRKQEEEAKKKREKEEKGEVDIWGIEEEGNKEDFSEEPGNDRQMKEADAERAFLGKKKEVHANWKNEP
ncbi:hypothetical protein HJG60_010943 [Phyllostomus discolor]|uniref:Calreticulin-like n=1 Tax=Phyllostomus discolor TaxID=89673 RepID=A0A834E6L6_9CHIR|nr:hypothetical protein HJG60_010943 [Phyllostomus discolor]